ncbi:MAG: hypothetical protein ACM3NQ_11495 [Bacteroidales bacterium]
MKAKWTLAGVVAMTTVVGLELTAGRTTGATAANVLTFSDETGQQTTITTAASIDTGNPFFQALGTNGRACVSCHRPAQAWTITPVEVTQRFNNTQGLDPIFRSNDGSNCKDASLLTLDQRRAAFSLLMNKGLIRVGLPVPDGAEFEIVAADDPYGCGAPLTEASMYRRPLPATNLSFLSTVMWDGRETVPGQAIDDDLASQALHATTGHEQGVAPSADQLTQIVAFETALFSAQSSDDNAGKLDAHGANGGPGALSTQSFCIGINDPFGLLPVMPGACAAPSSGLDTHVFTIFDGWATSSASSRSAIARGENLFNTRTFVVDNVEGLNGSDGTGPAPAVPLVGTCSTCHNTPNVGDHSIAMPLNIGVADASRRTPDLPLYTLRNKATGATVQTTDPGRAMVTGRWADIGKFKGPVLRALAARAPYFHNGSAAALADVVEFYNTRFGIGLTAQEKADLVAFLLAL